MLKSPQGKAPKRGVEVKMFYVYMISNRPRGVVYIGITNDLSRRIYEHKNKLIAGFSKRYNLNKLVYVEEYSSPEEAIAREKQLKNWRREWKIHLIEAVNPKWADLYA
jgi:putative endonuclease